MHQELTGVLELPRLRVLEAQAAAVPVSSSAASSVSPRSRSSRVHPYPVGEVVEGSSYELVPSMATPVPWRPGVTRMSFPRVNVPPLF